MKKIISLTAILCAAFAVSSCDGKGNSKVESAQEAQETSSEKVVREATVEEKAQEFAKRTIEVMRSQDEEAMKQLDEDITKYVETLSAEDCHKFMEAGNKAYENALR